MTTHRNLKPHYAEPKGKSGPVIVVKKANDYCIAQGNVYWCASHKSPWASGETRCDAVRGPAASS